LTTGLAYVLLLFMAIPADITEKHDRMLDELADLAMDLARDLAAKARDADSLEDVQRLSRAFDRMTRSVRLTVALQRRLYSDARRDGSAERTTAVALRKAQVRACVHATIRDASGLKSYEVRRVEMERELDERLAEQALYQAFLDTPLDVVIAQLRHTLGLPPAPLSETPRPSTPSVGGVYPRAGLRPDPGADSSP
jgi:hypothetical protein